MSENLVGLAGLIASFFLGITASFFFEAIRAKFKLQEPQKPVVIIVAAGITLICLGIVAASQRYEEVVAPYEWSRLLDVNIEWAGARCGGDIPSTGILAEGFTLLDTFSKEDGSSRNWIPVSGRLPEFPSSGFSTPFIITNELEQGQWIEISDSFVLTILPRPVEENIEGYAITGECGGGSEVHDLSLVSLHQSGEAYEIAASDDTYDYFKLEPGESERFLLNFQCEAPGIYHVFLEIEYTYMGEDHPIGFGSPFQFVCPQSGFVRDAYDNLSSANRILYEMIWDGGFLVYHQNSQ